MELIEFADYYIDDVVQIKNWLNKSRPLLGFRKVYFVIPMKTSVEKNKIGLLSECFEIVFGRKWPLFIAFFK